ncbi:MAG: hypothetical protein WBA57_14960 [Elainellaceae cyanobacterium]
MDGGGLASARGGQPDAVAALCPLSRGAGAKQATPFEPLVAQQSSERPSTIQAVDSGGVSRLE